MAQRTTTRSASKRSKVQVQQAAGVGCPTEAHPNRKRRAKEAATLGPREVCFPAIVCVYTHETDHSSLVIQAAATIPKR